MTLRTLVSAILLASSMKPASARGTHVSHHGTSSGDRCWDHFLHRFFIGTDKCENKFSPGTCEAMFPTDFEANERRIADGHPPIASVNCAQPSMRHYALMCAKSCYICCETSRFDCTNPRNSDNFDCEGKESKCRDPMWLEIMRIKCPRTCGLCNYEMPTNGECTDYDDFCSDKDVHMLCTDEDLGPRMSRLCPKSCETCSEVFQINEFDD